MKLTVSEALQKGIEAHKAGQPQEAERFYAAILKVQPQHPDANHNMGVLAADLGKVQEALPFLKSALEATPSATQFWLSYIGALIKLERLFDAKAMINQASAMGIKDEELNKLEQLLMGVNTCQPIAGQASIPSKKNDRIKQNLDPPPSMMQPVLDACNQRQSRKALDGTSDLLDRFPNSVLLHNICGNCHLALRQYDAAIDCYKNAIMIEPDCAEAHANMGVAFQDKGELDAAIVCHIQALSINPDCAEAHNNLGNALHGKGKPDAAIDSYKKALKIKPNYAAAYNNMGNVLRSKREADDAIESYKKAIKIKPDYAEAHNNLGIALRDKGDLDAAIHSYIQSLNFHPHYAEAYNNIGNALSSKGDLGAAIDNYKKALVINPDYAEAKNNLLDKLQRVCDWSASSNFLEVSGYLGITTKAVSPLAMLALVDDPEKHLERSRKFAVETCKVQPMPSSVKPVATESKIRIGYFSSDFKEHPVAYLMAKVFESHDRESFDIYGYSLSTAPKSNLRERLEKGFDVFRSVENLSDSRVALIAREDGIDIAVDLTGHTKGSRPIIFGLRAAPIQINYLGYPGSMGADYMDYIIADRNLIPAESQEFYSEKPIYLPYHYQAQDDELPIADEIPSRASLGLPETGFVFCAINNTYKITPAEFSIWMRLLVEVSGSVLWLLESNRWAKENLIKEAQSRGVNRSRLVFAKKCSHEKYIAQFRQADLYLDTFAYNAGATASNALWAGLPVLTKSGRSYTARMASSLLNSIGLPELVTDSEKDYEELALELSRNSERLASIRTKLAANRLTSPLFKTELFTRHLEDGYKQAYQRYLYGQSPKEIYVSDQIGQSRQPS